MATITSVGSGLWSAAGTWDAGVPVDGDDVIISAGHTVEFNVDQSAFVTGVSVVITGVLTHTTTAGSYCLFIKTGASISGAGTWNIGTKAIPIPFASKHLITGVSGWYISGADGLAFTCYAAEPTIKYVQLTALEAIGQTVLSVDTDLTGVTDYWKNGDQVLICELYTRKRETYTISSITATEITLTGALSVEKSIGSVIVLLTRNVIVNCLTPANETFSGFANFTEVFIGGGWFKGTSALSKYCFHQIKNGLTLEGGVFYQFSYALPRGSSHIVNDVVLADNTRPGHMATGRMRDVIVVGFEVFYGWQGLIDGLFSCGNASSSFQAFSTFMLRGEIYNCVNVFTESEIFATNCNFYGGSNLGFNSDGELVSCYVGCSAGIGETNRMAWRFSNVEFASVTEFGVAQDYYYYIPSFDHDGVAGAFRSWTRGGITSSQASVLPVGYSKGYVTLLTNASWPGFWNKEITIGAGASVNIEMSLRKDAAMTYLPRITVFNKASTDPFAGGAGLKTFTMTDNIDTWESDLYTYTNSGSEDVTLVIRCQGMNATGNMYSALDIEQINVDLTSATALINAIKAKTDQLAFTVANQVDANALSGGGDPADVADAVWNEAIADHATTGSTGKTLAAAGSAGDPWSTALPGAYGAGTAGNIVPAIKAKTDLITTGTTLTIASAVSGSTITAHRGDTLSAALENIGALTSNSKVWFTVKRDYDDADTAAVIQIEKTGGLLYLNGAAGTSGNGSLTINDEATGDVTVVLNASETAKLNPGNYQYDIQILRSAGTPVSTLTYGEFVVPADVTRATS